VMGTQPLPWQLEHCTEPGRSPHPSQALHCSKRPYPRHLRHFRSPFSLKLRVPSLLFRYIFLAQAQRMLRSLIFGLGHLRNVPIPALMPNDQDVVDGHLMHGAGCAILASIRDCLA
jgi:hypothetical protein